MTRENLIDMINGHRLISDEIEGEIYCDRNIFYGEFNGVTSVLDQELSEWNHDGWYRKPEKKTRPMTRNEVLSLFVETSDIVVRYLEDPWDIPPEVTTLYPYSIDKCEWGIMEMGEVVKGPFKFEVEE